MTQPSGLELPGSGSAEIIAGVERLNVLWSLRYATMKSVTNEVAAVGVYDGDDVNEVPFISLIGQLFVGQRVATLFIPPSGNYVIASLGFQSDWVEYAVAFTSTGAAPNVGTDGTLFGRWRLEGHRTIAVEVGVVFGTVLNGMTQGTGRYFWSTPFTVTERSRLSATGACYILDTGILNRTAIVNVAVGNVAYFATASPNGDVGAGTPQIFTPGDEIRFSISHEISSF